MILQALNGYYERMSAQADSRIAPPGFSYQPISFAIVLAADGCIVDIDDLRESDGRRSRPRSLLVPQPPKRSGKKPKPGFLSDKTEYVFGLGRKKESEILVENPAYRQMFISLHDEALRNSSDVGLLAICRFLQQWSPAQYGNLRFANEMASTNVVFRLDGAREFVHAGIAAKSAWLQLQAKNKSKFGQCLILGVKLPIARLHPRISGIIKDGQKPRGVRSDSPSRLTVSRN